MISAFQKWGFGFGLELTQEELEKINRTRVSEKYCDIRASIETKRSATGFKAQLTKSPLVFEFGDGANLD